MKVAILASTKGTDMEAIFEAIKDGRLRGVEISMVISDRKDAYALERARNHGIKGIFVDPGGKKREEYDRELAVILGDVDLMLLIGYMRLLSPWFVERYRNRIINVHPSLLPAFGGGMDLDVHKKVLEYGAKVSGATVHFVDEGADTGPVILQRAVEICDDETPESLKAKVQKVEGELLVEVVELLRDGKIRVEERRVKIA
ncbi:MAG: phosphoribosylglycinamide formyltransferase [Candidatus Thermoplasmatota archaeon]|nr:phosphoribosylglycinamide formyltransferase [Candidatus Thermoplasmatota archaeon]